MRFSGRTPYSNEDISGRTPQGKAQVEPGKETPRPAKKQAWIWFVCAKAGPQARNTAPFPHYRREGRATGLSLGSQSPANERAFRSLRGSKPRSTGHVVLKIVDLSGSDSPEHCDFCTVCLRSSRTSPLEGEALLGAAPTGALRRPYGGPTGPYLGPNRGVWLSSADTPGTKLF